MTAAAERPSDEGFDYGFGIPGIDEEVRKRAAARPPLSATQRAALSALFNNPRGRR